MIQGMTGFGASEFGVGKVKGIVEIKTVNHRYLDVAFYLPSGFSSFEERIQKVIANGIKRGRVTVTLKITEKSHVSVQLNRAVVARYMDFAKNLGKEFHLNANVSVADLLRLPGVVEAKEVLVDPQSLWPSVEKALTKAASSVAAMRKREGKALVGDIGGQLKRMLNQISLIKARVAAIVKEAKGKLTQEEFAAFYKSNDINEELSRLAHYIDEAKALLKTNQGAGKKLDFIAQEMQRETNTIGSKVQDKIIAGAVIALKSKVEKIREQSNNVE